uniref:Uncharacterized protein n=1 Tax=Panagrolaimus sp. PS1159 TaxID=55785 RepID=A0AC35GIA9_9BILA
MPRLSASKFDKFKLQSKEQILDNRIYKHLFVTDSEWCEVDKDEIKKNIKNIGRELFDLLIENHIICETESGILSEIFYKNFGIKFQQFFKVKMDDLIRYGIPEDEADAIFQKLVNGHILVKLDNDNNN